MLDLDLSICLIPEATAVLCFPSTRVSLVKAGILDYLVGELLLGLLIKLNREIRDLTVPNSVVHPFPVSRRELRKLVSI